MKSTLVGPEGVVTFSLMKGVEKDFGSRLKSSSLISKSLPIMSPFPSPDWSYSSSSYPSLSTLSLSIGTMSFWATWSISLLLSWLALIISSWDSLSGLQDVIWHFYVSLNHRRKVISSPNAFAVLRLFRPHNTYRIVWSYRGLDNEVQCIICMIFLAIHWRIDWVEVVIPLKIQILTQSKKYSLEKCLIAKRAFN